MFVCWQQDGEHARNPEAHCVSSGPCCTRRHNVRRRLGKWRWQRNSGRPTGWPQNGTFCTPYNVVKFRPFSNFFSLSESGENSDYTITKVPTTPEMCRYTIPFCATLYIRSSTVNVSLSVKLHLRDKSTDTTDSKYVHLSFCLFIFSSVSKILKHDDK